MSKSRSPTKQVPAKKAKIKALASPPRQKNKPKKSALDIDVLMARFAQAMPSPRCELFYRTPYQLLVAVVLSAQATDKSVNKCMQPLFEAGFSPETVLALGVSGVLEKIRTIGLAPTKSKNVYRLTELLMERHGGEVPYDRAALEDLPGVGRKTANVVLGEIWREPTLAVDTHVFRVTGRLGLHHEMTPEKCEMRLLSLIDAKYLPTAHHWFILHGRYLCTAKNPSCDACFLADICPKIGAVKPAKAAKGR